jgi:hypothetical protein
MRRVILTFLLTSLFWWGLFTYYAYKKSGQEVSMTDEFVGWLTDAVEQTGESGAIVESVEMEDDDSTTDVSAVKMQKQTAEAKSKSSSTNKAKPKQTENVAKKDIAPQPVASASQQLDALSQEIVGKWQPVEGAEYSLEFTKYGTAIQYRSSYLSRHPYSLNGNIANIGYSNNLKIEITAKGGVVYLEIYDSDDFSGKYKRVSRPKEINYNAISGDLYSTAIVGKWTPIDGQEYAMEFTKYGVAIQVRNSYNSRTEYKLEGNKLKIAYDNNARVALWEDNQYYYLEIFNTEDFSGRYRKTK